MYKGVLITDIPSTFLDLDLITTESGFIRITFTEVAFKRSVHFILDLERLFLSRALLLKIMAPSVIVNEVLCFMKHKVNIIPFDILLKLCTDFYSDNEVKEAKEMFFETAFTNADDSERPRKVGRTGTAKRQKDAEDILKILMNMKHDDIPCMYVAADLTRLPPVGPNSFDLSGLIKDIAKLKEQMSVMQEAQRVNILAHQSLCQPSVQTVPGTTTLTPSIDSSAATQESTQPTAQFDSQSTIPKKMDASGGEEGDIDDIDDEEGTSDEDEALQALVKITENRRKMQQRSKKRIHMSAPNTHQSSALRSSESDVTKRTVSRKDRGIIGSGRDFALKATSAKRDRPTTRSVTGLFVTRLARNTRVEDVRKHIRLETGVECRCEPLVTKYDSYTSYCIRCSSSIRQRLMDPQVWPKGTLVREYTE